MEDLSRRVVVPSIARYCATSTDTELPATSLSLENLATSSGTSRTSLSNKIGQEQSALTPSLGVPARFKRGAWKLVGSVHRALEPSRDETHGLPPDTCMVRKTKSANLAEKASMWPDARSSPRTSMSKHLGASLE